MLPDDFAEPVAESDEPDGEFDFDAAEESLSQR